MLIETDKGVGVGLLVKHFAQQRHAGDGVGQRLLAEIDDQHRDADFFQLGQYAAVLQFAQQTDVENDQVRLAHHRALHAEVTGVGVVEGGDLHDLREFFRIGLNQIRGFDLQRVVPGDDVFQRLLRMQNIQRQQRAGVGQDNALGRLRQRNLTAGDIGNDDRRGLSGAGQQQNAGGQPAAGFGDKNSGHGDP